MTSIHERSRTIFSMLEKVKGTGRMIHVFYGLTTCRVYAFIEDHPNIIQARADTDFVEIGMFGGGVSVLDIQEKIIATIARVEKTKGLK